MQLMSQSTAWRCFSFVGRLFKTIVRSLDMKRFYPYLLILFLFAISISAAGQTLNGRWEADNRNADTGKIHLNLQYSTDNGNGSHGHDFKLDDLNGLTAGQIDSQSETNVKFQIVREAGTIDFDGSFKNGRGDGNWRFTASQSFVEAMTKRGFTELTAQKLFSAAMFNITIQTADGLKSAGLNSLTTDDLFKAAIFKITPEFATEMRKAGYPNITMHELVKARIFKIDAAFAKQAREAGVGDTMEELVRMSIFKITPDYLRDLKNEFGKISIDDAVRARIFKVTPEFVKEIKNEGLKELTIDQFVKLHMFKVDAAFIQGLKAAKNWPLDVGEIVRLKIMGNRWAGQRRIY